MPRLLNLNDFSSRALTVIVITGILAPGTCWLLRRLGLDWPWLGVLMRTGLWTGSAQLALFTALILVEQTQDHLLYRAYRQREAE